jgi:hypothetical protein
MTTPSEAAREWQEVVDRVGEAVNLSDEDVDEMRQAIVDLASTMHEPVQELVDLPAWVRTNVCPAPLGLPRIPEPQE